jgi:SAM-dependent methyltransferase
MVTAATTAQTDDCRFELLNRDKANFDRIYELPDPREYLRVLGGLDYVIPDLAKGVLRSLIARCARTKGRRVKVLDLGCSYGINAALVRFPLDMQRMSHRYNHTSMHGLSVDQLVKLDSNYFGSWPEQVNASFAGLDVSQAAIDYAKSVSLIEAGVAANLESDEASDEQKGVLADADIIVSTGCVGYVTDKTFQRLLSMREKGKSPPWVASFVLRMFPYDAIEAELAQHGLVTEKLGGVTFVQRRFHSESELEATIAAVKARGLDPHGKEADGLYHAELFVSRPEAEVRDNPLNEIVSVTSGENRRYGRRYRWGSRKARLMQ